MKLDIRYYIAVLLRRLHYIVIIFSAVTALSGIIAYKLPQVYESSARLLLESGQIPDALAAPTVDTAALEQLQIIEQRLMTRSNLLEIARKFKALPDIAAMAPDDIVTGMRENTSISKQTGRDQATLMTITFAAERAQIAAGVVNEYVTRILADSTATRTGQAQDTLQFFRQEVDRLNANLSQQSAKILEFQNQNADALPDTLTYRLTLQSNLQERLSGVERDIAGLRDQKRRLIEIYRATGQLDGGTRAVSQTPEAAQLAALQLELNQALAVYSPENPKVKILQSRIAELQAKVSAATAEAGKEADAAPQDGTEDGAEGPAAMTPLDIQTTQIDAQIGQLTQQRDDIAKQLAALTDSIDRSAGVAVQLAALNRDYANIQTQYDTATDRLSKASTGERIEALSKGQRIGVLDAATVPDAPARPNRVRIIAIGAVLGLALGLGLVGLLEVLNSSVRRPVDLERHLNITPIGTIPYARTPGETFRLRLAVAFFLLAVVAGLPAAVYLVDTYYMPVDVILAKISSKLGV
jgi:polysaccharide chain length determinant protein (PEP-CTERM system associated)